MYAKGFEDNRWLGILDVFIVKEEGMSVIWSHKSAQLGSQFMAQGDFLSSSLIFS